MLRKLITQELKQLVREIPETVADWLNDRAEDLRRVGYPVCSTCTARVHPLEILKLKADNNRPVCPMCWVEWSKENP